MFGIGTTEVLLILVVALLVIGPSKLPEVARTLGKGMAEFRRMSSDVKRTIDFEAQLADNEYEKKQADASTGGAGKTAPSSEEDNSAENRADSEQMDAHSAPEPETETGNDLSRTTETVSQAPGTASLNDEQRADADERRERDA